MINNTIYDDHFILMVCFHSTKFTDELSYLEDHTFVCVLALIAMVLTAKEAVHYIKECQDDPSWLKWLNLILLL